MKNNHLLPNELQDYIESHSSQLDPIYHDIERNTYLHALQPHMLSGNYQGQFLKMISQMIQPKIALDIGTFTGYSALCILEGLPIDGIVHTMDYNEEIIQKAKQNCSQHPKSKQIKFHQGQAIDILPTISGPYDLVYIDADKENYINYYNHVVDNMQKNGVILVDNVLWKGKVLTNIKDKKTKQIQDFNQFVQEDERVSNVLLPIRDGLMLIVKQ